MLSKKIFIMKLIINTALENHGVYVAVEKEGKIFIEEKIIAEYQQAEKLLPEIDKLLKKKGLKLSDIKQIKAENRGGTFTSLRIGVVTANALAYALDIPIYGNEKAESGAKTKNKINIIRPKYNREPIIS